MESTNASYATSQATESLSAPIDQEDIVERTVNHRQEEIEAHLPTTGEDLILDHEQDRHSGLHGLLALRETIITIIMKYQRMQTMISRKHGMTHLRRTVRKVITMTSTHQLHKIKHKKLVPIKIMKMPKQAEKF